MVKRKCENKEDRRCDVCGDQVVPCLVCGDAVCIQCVGFAYMDSVLRGYCGDAVH
jgi:hypothetical protein